MLQANLPNYEPMSSCTYFVRVSVEGKLKLGSTKQKVEGEVERASERVLADLVREDVTLMENEVLAPMNS